MDYVLRSIFQYYTLEEWDIEGISIMMYMVIGISEVTYQTKAHSTIVLNPGWLKSSKARNFRQR